MLENPYSKIEFEQLLDLQEEWCQISIYDRNIADVMIDMGLFMSTYKEMFPYSTAMINHDRNFLPKLKYALTIFDKVLAKEKVRKDEFNSALDNIGLAFQSLLFNLSYGHLKETNDAYNIVVTNNSFK